MKQHSFIRKDLWNIISPRNPCHLTFFFFIDCGSCFKTQWVERKRTASGLKTVCEYSLWRPAFKETNLGWPIVRKELSVNYSVERTIQLANLQLFSFIILLHSYSIKPSVQNVWTSTIPVLVLHRISVWHIRTTWDYCLQWVIINWILNFWVVFLPDVNEFIDI